MDNLKVSVKCLKLIKHYESLHDGDLSLIGLQPKMDPVGYWTEGYGHLMIYQGRPLRGLIEKDLAYKFSEIKTEQKAESVLREDIMDVEFEINRLNLKLNQNEFDSIVSFCYNIGITNFKESTLLTMLNGKRFSDDNLIRDEFFKWKYSNGKVFMGLYYRRKSEAELFITGDLKYYN